MTVKSVISQLLIHNLNNTLINLEAAGAPEIVIKSAEDKLDSIKAGNLKVERMARKYKIADEEVSELYQADAKVYDWKNRTYNTVVLKIVTESGTYYYDYFTNSIGKEFEMNICGNVANLDYEQVTLSILIYDKIDETISEFETDNEQEALNKFRNSLDDLTDEQWDEYFKNNIEVSVRARR